MKVRLKLGSSGSQYTLTRGIATARAETVWSVGVLLISILAATGWMLMVRALPLSFAEVTAMLFLVTSPKAVTIMGALIELIGFAILARELIRTNRDVLSFARSLSATQSTSLGLGSSATALIVDDRQGVSIVGGSVGNVAPSAKQLAAQVEAGRRATWLGIYTTVIGVALNVCGTILS